MNDLLSRVFSRPRAGCDLEPGVEMEALERELAPFFEQVDRIEIQMDVIKELLHKLQEANEESKAIHKAAALKALRDRMDQDVRQVSKTVTSIKQKLQHLDTANSQSRQTKGNEAGTATDRSRTAITNSLRKKLKDYMLEFSSLRTKILGEYKETIERRYFAVTGSKPDDETLEHIIETGESETFLQQAIQEQGRGPVIETMREIQERHAGVKEIEKNLLDLHRIFEDMAVLVERQGEQLDDIEANVNGAQAHVETAVTQIHAARRLQLNSRKWTVIGIILLLIIILIIVAILLIVLNSTGVI